MSPDLTANSSLTLLLDMIPIVVIITIIVAIVLSRHNYRTEKKELHTAIMECEKTGANDKEITEAAHE